MNRLLWFSCLIIAVVFSGFSTGWPQSKPGAPVITGWYGVERGMYRDSLKIYIEAEDPEGDMLRIATVVNQYGYGYYSPDWTFLKKENQKHFKGYLQWNTTSTRAPYLPEWTQIFISVSVFDKAGNESNQIVIPFMFESGVRAQYDKLPPPFDQGEVQKLGNVNIELFNPMMMGDGGGTRIVN